MRHHDGEDGEDSDRADIHHDLREADELRVELKVERGDAGEAQGQRQHAMDGVAKAHGCRRSGNGEGGEDKECYGHLNNSIRVAVNLVLHI